MAKGYAGIEKTAFPAYPNCLMLFGDAKQTIRRVVSEAEGNVRGFGFKE